MGRTIGTMAAILLAAASANAQNLREIPLGGTSAVMGGAGVGMNNDSSAPMLNPAGVAANAGTDLLSVSASLYGLAILDVGNYFRPTGLDPVLGNPKVEEESFGVKQVRAIPTGLTYFTTLGNREAFLKHVVAMSVHAPMYYDASASGTFRADGNLVRIQADQNVGEKIRMIYFGPTYSLAIGSRVRIGLSVFAHYGDLGVDDHRVSFLGVKLPNGTEDPLAINNRFQIDARAFGLAAVIGGQFNLWRDLWAGIAFETAGLPLWGEGSATELQTRADYDEMANLPVTNHTSSQGKFKEFGLARPWRLSWGLAYKHKSFTIAADGHAHLPTGPFERGVIEYTTLDVRSGAPSSTMTSTVGYARRMQPTINLAIGGQLNISEKYRVSAGFLTDIDAREAVSNGQPNDRLNYYGGTVGFGMKGDPFDSTYGFSYRYGRGTMHVFDGYGANAREVPIDYDAHSFFIILSGTVEVGAGADLMARLFRGRQTGQAQAR